MAFDFACPDWFERLQRGETPIADLPLDEEEAERAVAIFNKLRVPDAIGQPALQEAAGEWIRDVTRAIFGSMETSALGPEVRQVGETFILVPKKNAKTTNAAAIAITFLLMNRRKNADMLIIGPTQKISEVAFEQAKGIIDADPDGYLQKRFHIRDHQKMIRDRTTGARLMVRTFGMEVLTGSKPVFCLIDEVHILGSIPYAADVLRQIRGGMMPFPESVLVMITTQSDHPPQGVFRSELDYARGVRDGRITGRVRMLPVLYEFPEEIQRDGESWKHPDLWPLVTPNMGRSITLDVLKDGFERAVHDGQGELIAWATQHLNVEVGLALHANRWVGVDFWPGAADPMRALGGEGLLRLIDLCEVAVVGIDGGGLDDLGGLFVMGRERKIRENGVRGLLGWGKAWAHKSVLERRKEIVPALQDFQRDGDLTICEWPTQDHDEMCEIVEALMDAGLLPAAGAIGLDAAGATAIVDAFDLIGVQAGQMVAVPQGYRLSSAIWGLERKLMDGSFRHFDQKLMAWSLGNARCEQKGNAVLITKELSGKGKIDPVMAMFNSFALMSRNPQVSHGSYLETSGLVVA